MMFETMSNCKKSLVDVLEEYSISQHSVDIKEIVSRFTVDVIGSCIFGIECNSLKNPNSEFRSYSIRLLNFSTFERLRFLQFFILPKKLLKALKMKQIPQDATAFFLNVIKSTVEYRETENIHRKDMINLLIEMKHNDKMINGDGTRNEKELSMYEITAQCFGFFVAGFETSSTAMTFALLELAINQDIQKKVREEIVNVLDKYNQELTYDAVAEMTYLHKVVCGKFAAIIRFIT